MNRLRTLVLAAAIAGTVAGCGGDDGNSTEALSPEAFRTAADKLCTTVNAKLQQIAADLDGTASNDAPILKKMIPALEQANEDFDQLGVPAKVKAAAAAFDDANQEQLDLFIEAQKAAAAGNTAKYRSILGEVDALQGKNDRAARRMGAPDCVSR